MIYSSPSNYWILPGALTFTLNALGDADKVSVAITAGAVIMAYANIGGTPIIDYNAAHNYRSWTIQASPTQLDRHDKVYVYARLERNGTDALIIYPYQKLDIYGRVGSSSSSSSSSSSDDGDIDPNYFYIMLGALTSSGSGTTPRTWADGEAMSYGTLDTDQQRNEQRSDDLARMFQRDANDVIWTQHDLTFVAGAKLLLLRMATLTGNTTVDVTTITRSTDFSAIGYGVTDTSIMTSAAVAKYISLYGDSLENKFLRKDQADATLYKLTMGEAEVTGDVAVGGDLGVTGDAAVGDTLSVGDDMTVGGDATIEGGATVRGNAVVDGGVTVGGVLKSDNFETGLRGWKMDRNGNLEAETAHFRSALEVDELRINRQEAQEGDTIFSENDQILEVEEVTEGSSTTYILTLKEKWEGYFTAQQYGNIIRGKINTLAAKEADVWPAGVDYTEQQYQSSQGTDAGGNKYYTSFMYVIGTHNTNPALDVNQIQVALYGDNEVPMSKNYPPCPLMAIARWGCKDYADPSDPHYEDVLATIKRRQSMFMLTTTDGHIIKLRGVNKPILENFMIGTTLGELPDFVKNWNIGLIDGRDYLFAQGVVVGDFIKVDIEGAPIVNYVDCGEWVDGSTMQSPSVGNGIYLCNEKNESNLQWETHDVWHNGSKWRALSHQPVVTNNGNTITYYEPKYGSQYWQHIEGDSAFYVEFSYSEGNLFSLGNVSTTITAKLMVGQEDITDDVNAVNWSWQRLSDHRTAETIAADNTWNDSHRSIKTLALTNADMPEWWDVDNRILFKVVISVADGKNITFNL